MQSNPDLRLRLEETLRLLTLAETCVDAQDVDALVARAGARLFEIVEADLVALVLPPGVAGPGPTIHVCSRQAMNAMSERSLRDVVANALDDLELDRPSTDCFEIVRDADLRPLHSPARSDEVYPLWTTRLEHAGEVVGVLLVCGYVDWVLSAGVEALLERAAPVLGRAVHQATCFARLLARTTEDPLTGVLNRRGFDDALRRECDRAQRSGRELSLVLIDVDHFKDINDQYGHPAGDALLVSICQKLRQVLRRSDLLCRIGGDEFAVILPEVGVDLTSIVGERLISATRQAPVPSGALPVSLSMGVAELDPRCSDPLDELIRRADEALYAAKRAGRGRISRAV